MSDLTYAPIAAALQSIAAQCDGAETDDSLGFSAADTAFGRTVAALPLERWTPEIAWDSWNILYRYQGQLARNGIAFETLAEPAVGPSAANAGRSQVRVLNGAARKERDRLAREQRLAALSDEHERRAADEAERIAMAESIRWDSVESLLVVMFPYGHAAYACVKHALSSTWDPRMRAWYLSPDDAGHLKPLVTDMGFRTDDASRRLIDAANPAAPGPPGRLSVNGDRFAFSFPYAPHLVEEVKLLVGRRWDPESKTWNVPPSAAAVAYAQRHHFEIDPTAAQMAADVERVAVDLRQTSRSPSADLDVPGFGLALYPYQRAGIRYALQSRRCIIGDEPGIGKTRQALAAVWSEKAFPCLVVCPASLTVNWQREALIGMPGRSVAVVDSRRDQAWRSADLVIVSYQLVGAHAFHEMGIASLIVDESHLCANPSTKRTIAVQTVAESMPLDHLRLLLTGTPVVNGPAEFISQLRILDRLSDLGGVERIRRDFCAPRIVNGRWRYDGVQNPDQLQDELRACCYVRRTKAEALPDLPPSARNVVWFNLSDAQNREYRAAGEDIIKYLGDGAIAACDPEWLELEAVASSFDGSNADLPEGFGSHAEYTTWSNATEAARKSERAVRLATLRRLAVEMKLNAVSEWISSFLAGCDRKLVVFARHKHIVDALSERFGAERLSGSDSVATRQAAADRFQSDPGCRVLVSTLDLGVGLTLTAASDIAFVEMGGAGAHTQAEGRVHRIGQTASCVTSHYLLAAGTIDELMFAAAQRNEAAVSAALNGTGSAAK